MDGIMEWVPTDILNFLVNFCDIQTKWRLRCTNKRWFKLIDINEYICYSTNEAQFNDIVETLEKLAKPVSLKLCKNVFQELTKISDKITRVTNLTGLDIDAIWPAHPSEEWLKLTKLQILKSIDIDSMPTQEIVQHFPNLETISFSMTGDGPAIGQLTKLQFLSIRMLATSNDLGPFTNALLNLKHLTSLEINCNLDNLTCEQISLLLNSLHGLKALSFQTRFGFVESISLNRLTALEDLAMISLKFHSVNSTRLTVLRASHWANFDEFKSSLVNLKSLVLDLPEMGPEDMPPLNFLTALTALEKCCISFEDQKDPAVLSYLNSENLRSLSLTEYNEDEIDLSPLASMTALKKLNLNGHTLTVEEFSEIVLLLTNLTNLHISSADLADIDLSKLTRLKNCNLYVAEDGCKINVSNLPNLESLECDGEKAEFIGMENLTQLTFLTASFKYDSPPSFLRNFPNLIEISLVQSLGGELAYLTNSTNLQKIYIQNVAEEDIWRLALFSNLKYIRAHRVTFECQPRSNLVNSPITRLTNLEYLSWGDNSGLEELQTRLPKLCGPLPRVPRQNAKKITF